MTQVSTDASRTVITRTLPIQRQDVRTLGNAGAGGFEALFAEKIAPEPAKSEPTAAEEDLAKAGQTDEAAEEADQAQGEDEAEKAKAAEEQSTDQNKASGETTEEGVETQPVVEATGQAVDEATGAEQQVDAGVAEQPNVSQEQTGEGQVRRELKDAAAVDLSDMARAEMLGRVDGFRPDGPLVNKDAGSGGARPDGPPPPIDPRPGHGGGTGAREPGGSQDASGRAGQERAGLPTPNLAPPIGNPAAQGAETMESSIPSGKRPSNGGHPLSAPGAGRSAGDPPPDAKQQVTADVSRVSVLDKLVNQSAARRGAVAAIDRVQDTGTAESAVSRKASLSRPEPSNTARDVFLAPVQKGLGKMLAEGGGKMTVMLRPRELGDVKIQMETEAGAVRVRMEASSEAARKNLEAGFDALRANLETRGVRVETMEVTLTPNADSRAGLGDAGGRDASGERSGEGRQGGSQQDRQASDNGTLTPDAPRGIWTELGIDAVA